MLHKTTRQCIAASAIGVVTALAAPIASANSVSIILNDAVDLNSNSSTPVTSGAAYGMPFGTELKVEWWEWDESVGKAFQYDRCSFTIGVDSSGQLQNPDNVIYNETSIGQHQFRHRDGCRPPNAAAENSFLRIYPSDTSPTTLPVLVTGARIVASRVRLESTSFQLALESDRGSDTIPWSLSDVCEVPDFATATGAEFNALNANVNPVVTENGQDITNEGGLIIFPARTSATGAALAICDTGYIPAAGTRFPDPDATFSTEAPETDLIDTLPNIVAGANEHGQGLRNSSFRNSNTEDALNNSNVLSVLTYNLDVSPPVPEEATDFEACAAAGNGASTLCDLQLDERKRVVREIAESILAAEPDVIVLTGLQQDAVSGFGYNNWDVATVREEAINELSGIYEFTTPSPELRPSAAVNLLNCGSTTNLTADTEIYPDQTNANLAGAEYCSAPDGSALDSGILIGVRNDPVLTLEDEDFHRFQSAASSDNAISKGIKYAEVRKSAQTYHVFGTQTQSGRDSCIARIAQWREVANFITSKTLLGHDETERIVLTGDLNADPARDNHARTESGFELSCRNEMEYLVQKLRFESVQLEDRNTVGLVNLSPNSMPFSNDCLLNDKVEDEYGDCSSAQQVGESARTLIHTLWMGAKPDRSGGVFFRQTADGNDNGFAAGDGLSRQYPLLCVLDYRTMSLDNSLSEYFDYGSGGAAGFELDRPALCPYGELVEHTKEGQDFVGHTFFSNQRNTNNYRRNREFYDDLQVSLMEPELVCLPMSCSGNISDVSGDSCNPDTYAQPSDGVRNTCREGDENFAATCSVPAGYENLAKLPGVQFSQSDETDAAPLSSQLTDDATAEGLIADGKIYVEGDADPVGQARSWIGYHPDLGGRNPWVKVTFPSVQYVKRVRFWNVPDKNSTVSYILTYTDEEGNEHTFPDNAPYSETDATDYTTALHPDETFVNHRHWALQSTIAWTGLELAHPVQAKAITLQCIGQETGRCGVSELEIYGGAE